MLHQIVEEDYQELEELKKPVVRKRKSAQAEMFDKMMKSPFMYGGKFRIFRLTRSNDTIFVFDDPRWEQLEGRTVTLKGLKGEFTGRMRYLGSVTGHISSTASIYRMDPSTISLVRAHGVKK